MTQRSTRMVQRTMALLISAVVLVVTSPVFAQVAQWDVTTVTTSGETPMHLDCRRPMAAGYYDATAGQTFISFAGPDMDPYVAAYDHAAGAWGSPVRVNVGSSDDFHDYSHIFPSADGRVQVTYARHNSSLYIASSENPGSIDGTWNVRQIGNNLGATYPMPLPSTEGPISIMYRQTKSPTDYRPIKMVRSEDNGETWSNPVSVIDYNNSRSDHLNEIYLGGMSYEADHPSAALGEGYNGTWTLAGGGPTRNLHDDYHKNMYYAFFQMSDQHWYSADGTDLGTNITDTEAEAHAKVFDSGDLVGRRSGTPRLPYDIGYTSKAVLNSDGNPVVVFENGKNDSLDIGIWDGTQWSVTTPTTLEGQRGGLRDLARVGDEVWLLEKMVGGTRTLQLMDDGQWETIAEFSPPSYSPDNYFIDNAQPEVFILAVDDNLTAGGGVYSVAVPEAMALIPGDSNGDGLVDVGDLGILSTNYGMEEGATWAMGDFNGDGKVNVGDLGILSTNYGSDVESLASSLSLMSESVYASTNVPEPATMSLLALGGIALLRRRRNRG